VFRILTLKLYRCRISVWATTPPNFIKIERPLPLSGRSYLDNVNYF